MMGIRVLPRMLDGIRAQGVARMGCPAQRKTAIMDWQHDDVAC